MSSDMPKQHPGQSQGVASLQPRVIWVVQADGFPQQHCKGPTEAEAIEQFVAINRKAIEQMDDQARKALKISARQQGIHGAATPVG